MKYALTFCLVSVGGWMSIGSLKCEEKSPDASSLQKLKLTLRTRVETFKGSNNWDEVLVRKELPAKVIAIIICDMWDKHWCANATKRCEEMAKKMDAVLKEARSQGVHIIHAPSDCMGFYKDFPQRQRMAKIKKVPLPKAKDISEPALPVDASDGGCDDAKPDREHAVWTRQHPSIAIEENDVISDNGEEVYSLLKEKGIQDLLVMGVHTNMCVLGRSFAIRQMTKWGIRCILVRDLTDAMYNPKKSPFVSHDEGTQLVIEHIEKYWCPSIVSAELKKK
jgi:nicotinamidase-related amidase